VPGEMTLRSTISRPGLGRNRFAVCITVYYGVSRRGLPQLLLFEGRLLLAFASAPAGPEMQVAKGWFHGFLHGEIPYEPLLLRILVI
jgi:hypothetical protein